MSEFKAFNDRVGKAFVLAGPIVDEEGNAVVDADFSLTLVQAEEIGGSQREGGGFRLDFHGPANPILPQNTYAFTCDGEELAVFIVPIAQDSEKTVYEAVFF